MYTHTCSSPAEPVMCQHTHLWNAHSVMVPSSTSRPSPVWATATSTTSTLNLHSYYGPLSAVSGGSSSQLCVHCDYVHCCSDVTVCDKLPQTHRVYQTYTHVHVLYPGGGKRGQGCIRTLLKHTLYPYLH